MVTGRSVEGQRGTERYRDALQITMRCRVRDDVHGEPSPCLPVSDRGDDSLLANQSIEDVQLHAKHTVQWKYASSTDHLF